MSDMTDVIQIDLTSDISGAVQAQQALGDVAAKTAMLKEQLKAGTIDLATYNYGMSRVATASKKANEGFTTAMGGASKLGSGLSSATSGTTKLGGGFDNAAYKLQLFGGLLDDMQYVGEQGLRPIIGNVMQLSPAIGIALIAGQALYKNWDNLAGVFTGGATKTAAEEMEELRQKTSLTADEAERLARASRGELAVQAVREGRPELEGKAQKATEKAIAEAGGHEAVVGGLQQAAPKSIDAQPIVADAIERVRKASENLASVENLFGADSFLGALSGARTEINDANELLKQARKKAAEEMVGQAINARDNPGGRQKLIDAVEANGPAFGPGAGKLAADLNAVGELKSPEDEEEEKAQELLDSQLMDHANRLAQFQMDSAVKEAEAEKESQELLDSQLLDHANKLAQFQIDSAEKDEDEEKKAQELLDQSQQEGRERLADWQERNRQAGVDEEVNARAQDMMSNRNRTSQVFNGASSLRDSIQGAFGEKTALETLRSSQQIEANSRRQVEQLQVISQRVGGPAQAG